MAGAYTGLPKGDYRLDSPLDAEPASRLAFGWALGAYAFDRYRGKAKQGARLVWPAEADRDRVLRELDAVALLSDGASRLVDRFDLMSWPELLAVLRKAGPTELIARTREVEASDPDGMRWPRGKASDDATALWWSAGD